MAQAMHGLASHACEAIGQTIYVPIGIENYNSRVIVSAGCDICGAKVLEKQVDKKVAPSKGFYMTV